MTPTTAARPLTEAGARQVLARMPHYYGTGRASLGDAESVAYALDLVGSVAMGNMSLDEAAECAATASSSPAFVTAFEAAVAMLKAAK